MRTPISHPPDFAARHLGPRADDIREMLELVGCDTLDDLMAETVPAGIRFQGPLQIPESVPEAELLERLRSIASGNEVWRSYLGMGYSGTITPGVIQRNILENPGWYTQYTPYQAEIAQGRLEALLNFQTAVIDLTGLEIANASLLDEGTAAAEAMTMLYGQGRRRRGHVFLVAEDCHPQDDRGRQNACRASRHRRPCRTGGALCLRQGSLWCPRAVSGDRRSRGRLPFSL